MPSLPYSAIYPSPKRNMPLEAPALNDPTLPPRMEHADTGNAGADGYTVLSRANRYDGERPIAATPKPEGPNLRED